MKRFQKSQTLGFLVTLTALALSVAVPGCGSDGPTCGAGTHLDAATNTCLADPPSNVIVDDFTLGEYELSNIDVPEQLEFGTMEERTFTITNTGTDKRDVVMIRYGLAPVTSKIDELAAQLEAMTDGSDIDATFIGHSFIDALEPGASQEVTYYTTVPENLSGLYGLFFAIDEVPVVKGDDGSYSIDYSQEGVAESVGESRLTSAALVQAVATVIVGATDKPNLRILSAAVNNASCVLDESQTGDQALFTVNSRLSAQGKDVTEEVTVGFELKLPGHAIKTAGQDLGTIWFDLNGGDYDSAPSETTYAYDADRTFTLQMLAPDGPVASTSYEPSCELEDMYDEATGEVSEVERCATIFNDRGVDGIYRLQLAPLDLALLARTRELESLNQDLNANGEIPGSLVMTAYTDQEEYQDNTADNEASMAVVFMAPDAVPDATASDTNEANSDSQTPQSYGDSGPYPTATRKVQEDAYYGNEWFGAGYEFHAVDTHDTHKGLKYKSHSDNGFSLDATILKAPFTLVSSSVLSDWGADKDVDKWDAELELTVANLKVIDAAFDPGLCETAGDVTACPVFSTSVSNSPADGKTPAQKADDKSKKTPSKKQRATSIKYGYTYGIPNVGGLVIEAVLGITGGLQMNFSFIMDKRSSIPKYGAQFQAGPYVGLGLTVFGGLAIPGARGGVEADLTLVSVSLLPTIDVTTALAFDLAADCMLFAAIDLDFYGNLTVTGPSGSVKIVAELGADLGVYEVWDKVYSQTIADFKSVEDSWRLWFERSGASFPAGDSRLCANAFPSEDAVRWATPCVDAETSGTNSCYYGNASSANAPSEVAASHSLSKVNSAYQYTYTIPAPYACAEVIYIGKTENWTDRLVVYDDSGKAVNFEEKTTSWQECTKGNGKGGCKKYKTVTGLKKQVGWSGTGGADLTGCTFLCLPISLVTVCGTKVTAALETNSSVSARGGFVTFVPKL